jgi:histidyl-tRNA synthetase
MTKIDPYKGVRDFYPEDERIQKYIFSAMRRAVESFGYEEYNASLLESTELYTAKSSEEIINEQTYTFKDRGDRSVTLRPEMTPTVARMVAARKRELGFPLRWYSIPNLFRYERPQRGRLREHWQLNADLFGVPGIPADTEIIALAHRVMIELRASETDFVIRIGNREFLDAAYDSVGIPEEKRQETTRLLDAKEKGATVPGEMLAALSKPEMFEYFEKLQSNLRKYGIENAIIDATIARGFDYYTGMVFEVFDTNPENKRSMFGGGRYDNLVGQYGTEEVPAVGFAMGDVTARDFLETHGLLPDLAPATHLYLAPASERDTEDASRAADVLRKTGVNVALGMKHEKIGDHIKTALKLGIPHFAVYGDKEKESGSLTVKTLATESEKSLPISEIAAYLKARS